MTFPCRSLLRVQNKENLNHGRSTCKKKKKETADVPWLFGRRATEGQQIARGPPECPAATAPKLARVPSGATRQPQPQQPQHPKSPPQAGAAAETGRLMKRWTTSVAPTSEHCCSVLSLSSSQWLIQSSPRQGWYAYSWERDSWVSDQLIHQYCPATNIGATRCVPGWNRQDYCFVKAVMSACWGRTIISHYLHSLQSYLGQIHCFLHSFFFFLNDLFEAI